MIIYHDGPSINFVNSILEKDIIKRIPSDYSLNLLISSENKLETNNKKKSNNESINANNIQRVLINLLNYECEQSFILDKNDKEINNFNQEFFDNKQNSESVSNNEEIAQLMDENINEEKGISNKTKNNQNNIENQKDINNISRKKYQDNNNINDINKRKNKNNKENLEYNFNQNI